MMESYSVKEKQEQIRENIDRIREEIVKAALSCGRNPDDITLMAVTKTVDPIFVNTAIDCGIKFLGENRVQEFLSKKDKYHRNDVSVHMIGLNLIIE